MGICVVDGQVDEQVIERMQRITIHMPEDMLSALREEADRDGRISLADMIRVMLREELTRRGYTLEY